MGIRNLAKFVEEQPDLLRKFHLQNCKVVLDGDSICHQMYSQSDLICLFGGEYDGFYRNCINLFESFHKCEIKALVVFDGAQLDDRKWSTSQDRAQQRIHKSSSTDLNVDLSPLLLRQTFINVLDVMKIPYISALGEGDDECVSLANHLDCYLMADDSDYYCYNLRHGYVPFTYVDINPVEKDSRYYLSARRYRIRLLLDKFHGLQPSTLALACCLSGNDYISRKLTWPILGHIVAIANIPEQLVRNESTQTRHLYATMEWIRAFDDIDLALRRLLQLVDTRSTQIATENELRIALQSYLTPSDTLIHRFVSPENQNLLKKDSFVRRVRTYLDTLGENDDQLRSHIDNDSRRIRSKGDHPLPLFLVDAVSDCRLSPSFIEILIHRRLISKSHIEVQGKTSIHSHAIPILLPCFAILLKWDREQHDPSIIIYQRVENQLKDRTYSLNIRDDDLLQLDQIWSLPLGDRQNFVRNCLQIPEKLLRQWNHIHSDYHFWLMIIRYWYSNRGLSEVYLYAVIVCLIKFVFLRNNEEVELIREQLDSVSSAFGNAQPGQRIGVTVCRKILKKLNEMYKKMRNESLFDNHITHELNCLQTTYMHSLRVNEFFDKPFSCPIYPHYFISGSLFHAFVVHYKLKVDLKAAMDALFLKDTVLLTFMNNIYTCVSTANYSIN